MNEALTVILAVLCIIVLGLGLYATYLIGYVQAQLKQIRREKP